MGWMARWHPFLLEGVLVGLLPTVLGLARGSCYSALGLCKGFASAQHQLLAVVALPEETGIIIRWNKTFRNFNMFYGMESFLVKLCKLKMLGLWVHVPE